MTFPYQRVTEITDNLHGFYRIGHEAYHSGIGISSSRIKKALVSHAAYHYHGHTDSAALAFGRAFHAALLEPELYQSNWVLIDGHPNSNAYKANKSHHEANGREVISADDMITIAHMKAAVKNHPEIVNLPRFDSEIMAIARDPETGLLVKCKSDLIGHAIVDFKTTSGSLSDFIYDVSKWDYHVSAAFYQDVVHLVTGERVPFIIVPVTKKEPYECEFYTMSDDLLGEGRKLYKAALRQIKKWQETPEPPKKRMRTLNLNQKIVYSTKDRLEFMGQ